MNRNHTRRQFISFSAFTALGVPLALSTHSSVFAAERLSEDDPTAKALGYKEDTTAVDAASYPNHDDSQVCVGCALYQGDDPEWGGCGAFPGKLVAGQGWCVAYAPKS